MYRLKSLHVIGIIRHVIVLNMQFWTPMTQKRVRGIFSPALIFFRRLVSYVARATTAKFCQVTEHSQVILADSTLYTVSQKKNCATFIFTVTLANVGRFLKFFQCRNQKEMAHNKNEKFLTVA